MMTNNPFPTESDTTKLGRILKDSQPNPEVHVDNTMLVKVISASAMMACTMTLAIMGKIDGAQAMTTIQVLGATFLGGAAVLGGAQAIATAMTDKK